MNALRKTPLGIIATALGFAFVAGGLMLRETPAGALLWSYAAILSFIGYGSLTARLIGIEVSLGIAAALGLSFVLVLSTLVATIGLFSPIVQIAFVLAGITSCAWTKPTRPSPPAWVLGFVAFASLLLLGVEIADFRAWIVDGVNHTLEVKRLWDTASLASFAHQSGLQIVGDAYVAYGGGAGTAGLFEAGVCTSILVLLLATELANREDSFAIPVFVVLVIPIVLQPVGSDTAIARWSGVLLHLALFLAMQRTLVTKRGHAAVIIIALALIGLRWQLALVAAPYLAAAFLLGRDEPPSRRPVLVACVAWLGMLTILGGVRGALGGIALGVTAGLLTKLLVPVVSTFPRRSELGVVGFVLFSAGLAATFGVIPKAATSAGASSAIWLGGTFAVLTLVDSNILARGSTRRIRLLPAALILGVMIAASALWPNFVVSRRARLRDRIMDAVERLELAHNNGYDTAPSDSVRELQDHVPPGATIGVWGMSFGLMDFTRNPIRDLSLPRGRLLAPLGAGSVQNLEYVIVEFIEVRPADWRLPKNWGEFRLPPTDRVADALELVARSGSSELYRVRR